MSGFWLGVAIATAVHWLVFVLALCMAAADADRAAERRLAQRIVVRGSGVWRGTVGRN